MDVRLTHEHAQTLQNALSEDGHLVLWTLTYNPSDYPQLYIARPSILIRNTQISIKPEVTALAAILMADTLTELRNILPIGLTCLPRQSEDDPVIVEVWL